MSTIKEILDRLSQSKETDEGIDISVRLDFAELILRNLDSKEDWTQSRLATESGLQESYISRIIHSDANFQVSTLARIVRALGVRVTLVEVPASSVASKEGTSDGEETYIEEETRSEGSYRFEDHTEGNTRDIDADITSDESSVVYSVG